MLTLGDGIAIAGMLLVIFAVVVKWRTPMAEKYVTRDTCIATRESVKTQLTDIKKEIDSLFNKIDSLDKWLREHSYSGNLKI